MSQNDRGSVSSLVDFERIKKEIGVINVTSLAPALGTQLHGDDYRDIENALLITVEGPGDTSAYSGGLGWDTPKYMNMASCSVCRINPRKSSNQSVQVTAPVGGLTMIAPPCFNLRNKFSIHEQVLIVPDRNVVNVLLGNKHSHLNHRILYDYFNKEDVDSPMFVLKTKFRVTGIVYAEDPSDPHAYWTTYQLSHPKVPMFELPASMICRELELVPFVS